MRTPHGNEPVNGMVRLRDVYDSTGEPLPQAVEILFVLLCERPAEANISHQKVPTMPEHRAFVRSRPYRAWYIVCDAAFNPLGAVYLTNQNEVGVFILEQQQRKGYAERALRELMKMYDPLPVGRRRFLANVAPGNWRSKLLFEKKFSGRIVQLTYEI